MKKTFYLLAGDNGVVLSLDPYIAERCGKYLRNSSVTQHEGFWEGSWAAHCHLDRICRGVMNPDLIVRPDEVITIKKCANGYTGGYEISYPICFSPFSDETEAPDDEDLDFREIV